MTEQEQMEVLRKEFLSFASPPDCLAMTAEDILWQGFLMAKRSQPVIELPSGHGMTISYREAISDAKDAITAAGYQYKIKGE